MSTQIQLPHHLPPFTYAFTIRPARLSDCFGIGFVHTETFRFSTFTNILYPYRFKHLLQNLRFCVSRAKKFLYDPRAYTYVACPKGREEEVIGFAVFNRAGEDEEAKELVKRRDSWGLWFRRTWLKITDYIYEKFHPISRIRNVEAFNIFLAEGEWASKNVWVGKYENRWHCSGLVILPSWQRRGVGKALMQPGLELARKDNVPLGLEASTEGEGLYVKMGFEKVDDYRIKFDTAGAFYAWEPEDFVWNEKA